MDTTICRVIKSGLLLIALCFAGMVFAPNAEGQACLLADYHTAPIYDCVCGAPNPDCYADCGAPSDPDTSCLDGGGVE